MKFRHLTGSLLTSAALLTTSLPAFAGPFDVQPVGVFKTPVLTPVTGVGNATGNTATPAAPAANSNPVGNGEIQGLGDHQSWVDPNVLAKDPRALCSDLSLGSNTRSSSTEIALANSTSTRSSSSRTHHDQGGGGFNVLGIVGANGSGGSQGSQNNSDSKDTRTNRTEKNSSSSATVVQGKNCDAFVNSAAARDMNYQDNLTRRYEIKVGRRGQQVNQLIENK